MYTLVPSYVNDKLDYYVANVTVRDPSNPSQETKRFDYIIGRDKLDEFIERIETYEFSSVTAFEYGAKLHLDQWQIDLANGDYGSAYLGWLKVQWHPVNIIMGAAAYMVMSPSRPLTNGSAKIARPTFIEVIDDASLATKRDLYHNFPKSIENEVIESGVWSQRLKDKQHFFELPGEVNGVKGTYQLELQTKERFIIEILFLRKNKTKWKLRITMILR